MDHASPLDTEIAEQSGAGGAEAEGGVFDDGLAAADGGEEVVEVVVAVGVSTGGCVLFDCLGWRAVRMRHGIFLAILLEVILLHGVGKG